MTNDKAPKATVSSKDEIEVTPLMVVSGVDALFASGLVQWNRPRLAVQGAVEEILWAALIANQREQNFL